MGPPVPTTASVHSTPQIYIPVLLCDPGLVSPIVTGSWYTSTRNCAYRNSAQTVRDRTLARTTTASDFIRLADE
eukprot:2973509-Pyramimonas_sp.AAC.1